MAEQQVVMLGRHGNLPLAESYVDRASHEAGACCISNGSFREGQVILTLAPVKSLS